MAFNSETGRQAGKKSKRKSDAQLKEIREKFSDLIKENQVNIQRWLESVAEDDPAKALELILKMSSFVLPKPRSIELSGSIDQKSVRILNIDPLKD